MPNYIGLPPKCIFSKQASEGQIPHPPYNEQGYCARGIPPIKKRMQCCGPAISSMLRLELTHVLSPGDIGRVIKEAPRSNTMRNEALTILDRKTRRQREEQIERSSRGKNKSRRRRGRRGKNRI